jgi:hypothetical protein
MRKTASRILLGLALLAATPWARADVRFGGDLGLSMNRNDTWSPDDHSGNTLWWFTGGLHLDASLFTPGTLDLGASASYLGYRAVGGAASDALNYQLHLNALARTPLILSASAGRSTIDFTGDTSSRRVGSTRVDSLSGTVVLSTASYPFLAASIRNTATTNRSLGAPEVKSDATTVSAEASQSLDGLNYTLNYGTGWSSGDYAETNYRDHGASLRAQAQLASNVTAQVMATYNLRQPTLASPLNPRLDSQTLSTWLQWAASNETAGGGGYSYSNALFDAPGSPIRQSISHSVNGYGSHRLSEDLSIDLSASGSAGLSRVGATEVSSTGEQAGAGVRWRHQIAEYATQASLSGSLGLYQPSQGPTATAWGLGVNTNASRPVRTWTCSAGLSGSYDENTGASAGHRTRLLGTLAASGDPLGWTFSSMLNAGYSSSVSPSFGKTSQTNLRLEAQANRNGYNLGVNAGITDDLAEVLVPGAPPASLLIPVTFNTQARFVVASATVPTVPRLFLTLVGRALSVSSPGRVSQWESGLSLSASYYLGAFQLSLYDLVTIGGTSGVSSGTQNLLFISVSRSFGR